MNPRILMSLLPVVIFWALWRTTETAWLAIVGGFAASTFVLLTNRQQRLIGVLTLYGFVIVGVSSAVGIVWDSPKAYLASGPVSDLLFFPLYLVSIAMGKPLVGGISRELFPAIAGRLPEDHRVFVVLSVAWGAYNLAQGVARFYMLKVFSVGEYLVYSRLISWPFSAALMLLSAWMIYGAVRRLHAHGHGVEAEAAPA